MNDAPVIAVDGPGSVGKSTLSCELARRLRFHLLVSGALYRIVGARLPPDAASAADAAAIASVVSALDVRFVATADGVEIECDGRRVTAEIGGEETAAAAARAGESPLVRTALLAMQRACRKPPGLVADGRDMGTVVFCDAALKVFLTAERNERARRRYKQLRERGVDVTLQGIAEELARRDQRDRGRALAPLRAADDAVILDTTNLSVAQAVSEIVALATQRNIGTSE